VSSVAEVLAARKPRKKSVRLVLDGQSHAELELARNELKNLRLRERVDGKDETLASQIPGLERKIQELEADLITNAPLFTFQAIGRRKLDEIRSEHPPTEEQWDLYRERSKVNPMVNAPSFDPQGLAPKLLAASALDPPMSIEEASELWDSLSDGESAQLYEAAWSVNMEAASVPLSASDIAAIGSSGGNSITQRVAESLGLPSQDGS